LRKEDVLATPKAAMAQMTRQQVAREQITVRDSVPTRRIEEPYVPAPRFHEGNWYDIIDGKKKSPGVTSKTSAIAERN
jgi:hypothetical protein